MEPYKLGITFIGIESCKSECASLPTLSLYELGSVLQYLPKLVSWNRLKSSYLTVACDIGSYSCPSRPLPVPCALITRILDCI